MMRCSPGFRLPWPKASLLLLAAVFALAAAGRQTPVSTGSDAAICPTPSGDAASLHAFLQRTAAVLREQDREQKNFTWQERDSRQQLSGGVTVHSNDETWDIFTIAGEPYKRLIGRNGQPLSADEQKEQRRKLQTFIEEHEPSSAEDRNELAEKRKTRRDREQRQQAALLHNFHFTLTGSRPTPWGKAWVIHATPIPGLNLEDKDARMMSHFAGDLWIGADGCHLMRLDLSVLDPIPFGWVLGKVDRGGHLLITFAPVEGGNWFPQQFTLQAQGRILFKHLDIRVRNDYFDYHRFQVESRMLPAAPVNDR